MAVTMARKQPFPPEPPTQPDLRKSGTPRASGPAPRSKRSATTVPPKGKKGAPAEPRSSGVAPRRTKNTDAGATVDEVVADLSKDPRRERDDD
jgi:hypothetical protein